MERGTSLDGTHVSMKSALALDGPSLYYEVWPQFLPGTYFYRLNSAEKLIVTQLVKEFPASFGTDKNTVFTAGPDDGGRKHL
jgi:hypothetical protein